MKSGIKLQILLIALVLSVTSFASHALANDLPCLIKINPSQSIQEAVDSIAQMNVPNCTIWMAAGTYYEGISFTDAQSAIQNLTIVGAGMDKTILRRNGGDVAVYVDMPPALAKGTITLKDLTIDGSNMPDNRAGVQLLQLGTGTLKLDAVRITNFHSNETNPSGTGIEVSDSALEVVHSLVDHNRTGVSIYNEDFGVSRKPVVTLLNDTLVDNEGIGIYMKVTSTQFPQEGYLNVINTIIAKNAWGLHVQDVQPQGTKVFAEYDIFHQNGIDILGMFSGSPDTNLFIDPKFMNPPVGNYHLKSTSPAINTGDPLSPHDPNGTRSDIGAFPLLVSLQPISKQPAP